MTTIEQGARLVAHSDEVPDLDPIALFGAAREVDLEAVLWLQPAAGVTLVGIGRAWSVEPHGRTRFAVAGDAWRALAEGTDGARGDRPPGVGPVLLGGLGFTGQRPATGDPWEPFGAASLVLPELTFARTTAGTWRTVATAGGEGGGPANDAERRWERLAARAAALAPAPGAVVARPVDAPLAMAGQQPDRATWDRLVGLFAGAVGRGRLDKVVLARRVDLRSPLELDVENALRRLAASAPESTIFAFVRGASTFLGATPERLVRTQGRTFETVAIAGSAPRGVTRADDAARAVALLASDKEREEHAVVVDMLRASLGPLTERLEVGPGPVVLPLRHVQHLATPVRGRLRVEVGPAGLLALGERLHPTPAVGGEPRDQALELIAEHEGFDRGWYAGPVGWLGVDGDGELMVALRSGVVTGRSAWCFAGCGIMADSDPAREWDESCLKLRTVVSALGQAGVEVTG